MLRYAVNRVLLMIPTLLGVAVLVFFMLRVVPGDVVEIKLRGDGGNVSQETIELERKRIGLDKPLVTQFGDWMIGMAKLDFGKSMWTERPVIEEIALRLELSLQVALMATLIAVLLAIPMGTLAALYRDTWIDYVVRILTIGGLSIPSFWFGMLIMLTLLAFFNWLPPITFTPIYVDPIANLTQLIWPAMAVGYRYCAVVARMIRSSLLEVLNEDYIRTARAKGVFERLVISRHALRNALLPAITVIGLEFTFLIGGLVVTEQVFNLNGIGQLFVQSISRNDFTLIQGLVMLIAGFYVFVNLAIDLLYAVFDPRIRYDVMTIAAPAPAAATRQPGAFIEFCKQQPLGAVSFVIICVMMFAGIFSPLVAPYDPLAIDFASLLAAPSWDHWCGTDAFGRDICSRLIYGSRTALVIGFTSSFVGSTLGATLGVASAYFGGKIDDWIQRFVDILLAFPLIVLALVVVAAFRKFTVGGVDVNLIVAIAIPIIPRVARVVRAAALSVRTMPYVDAARAAGYSHSRIIFRHMAPNVVAPYLIMLTAFIAQAILAEASLSFLGLGVTEPTAAWGLMLSGNAADFYREAPWMILFPGAMISLAVFAFNLFGDSLRDFLDPRFKV